MAVTCDRHPFEYAENVCSSCGMPYCHDCLVYPRGPKKPTLCVPCAIAKAGVRSSARNHSNLSRREVKKRVRDAKGLQQPQPQVEAPMAASSTDRDFELTSDAAFDQGWAVSWDEGRDPHPGYPEPVHVTWGNDPFPAPAAGADEPVVEHAVAPPPPPPPVAAPAPPPPPAPAPAPVAAEPDVAVFDTPAPTPPAPRRKPELPRLQKVVAERPPEKPSGKLKRAAEEAKPADFAPGHAPARPGGLPSVRPPLKSGGAEVRTGLPPVDGTPPAPKIAPPRQGKPGSLQAASEKASTPAQQEGAATPPSKAPSSGRLRRKEPETSEGTDMLGWLDDLLGVEKGQPGQ